MDIAAAQVTFGMIGLVDRIDLVTAPNLSVDEVADKEVRAGRPFFGGGERWVSDLRPTDAHDSPQNLRVHPPK